MVKAAVAEREEGRRAEGCVAEAEAARPVVAEEPLACPREQLGGMRAVADKAEGVEVMAKRVKEGMVRVTVEEAREEAE